MPVSYASAFSADIQQTLGITPTMGAAGAAMPVTDELGELKRSETTRVENARAKSAAASQPSGGKVTREAGGK